MTGPGPARRARRAVVIDDSDVVLGMMEMLLEDEGWQVAKHTEAFGIDAAVLEFEPQLVLLDVGMRGLTEAMLPARIAALSAGGAKVLLHSGRGEEELRALAAKVGADGHLAKTGDIGRILNVLNAHLD